LQIVKNTLKKLGLHRLYQFLHTIFFLLPRVLCEETKLILTLLTNGRYAKDEDVVLASLRTCAHIIDKGLQADNWQPDRAISFYSECVKNIKQLEKSTLNSDDSYKWAKEKVLEYEKVQETSSPLHLDYSNIHNNEHTRQLLRDIITSRRSVRSFLNKSVDADVLKELVSVVNWASSSCNRQPIVLHITQQRELVRKCLNQCAGSTCFSEIEPPCFIAVCVDIRFYRLADRHVFIVDGALGIQNLLLFAHTYGIEGTVLNWMQATRREEKKLREMLAIPKYERIIFNIALGYPSKAMPAPGRKEVTKTYHIQVKAK